MPKADISIIINTFNHEKMISSCIKSIKKGKVKPREIIVVDDGSNDKTVEVSRKLGVRVLPINHLGRGLARDYGRRHAEGKFVAYLDADMEVNKAWVKEIMNVFDSETSAVIDRIKVWKPDNFYTKTLDSFYDFRSIDYKPFVAWAFRKSLLRKVGGFRKVWLEDADLSNRILKQGYKIKYARKAIRYHKGEPRSFANTIKRGFFFGKFEAIDIYPQNPEKFPKKTIILYLGYWLAILISLILGFTNTLFFWYPLIALIGLYVGLTLKFAFIQGAAKYIKPKYLLGNGLTAWIRALTWPAGIIYGTLKLAK